MQSENVLNILAELAQWPDCYVVGGGVRDLLLRRKPSDFNLVLPKPEQALSIVKSKTNSNSFILGEKIASIVIVFWRAIIMQIH